MNSDQPVIYLIDDESQRTAARAMSNTFGIEVEYLYPTEVTPEHLARATLLAVDQNLFLREGTAPDDDLAVDPSLPTALVPEDGIALCAVFRSASKKVDTRLRPLGLAIRSGALDELTAGLPQAVRQPLVADQHDLEWVVAKEGGNPTPETQLVSLAQALATYPTDWGELPARDLGTKWLAVPDAPWAGSARTQIGQCRPPVEVASSSAHGLAWLRWLAHQILPFPTFLIDLHYVAASLGVSLDSLRTLIEGGNADGAGTDGGSSAALEGTPDLITQLRVARYTGPMAQMHPDRFWRAGIDSLVRQLSDGAMFTTPDVIARALVESGYQLAPLELEDPVVCIDENYAPSSSFIERSRAVRLTPDGWPPYADPAWADPDQMSSGDVQRLSIPPTR